jgi:type IV pilus assembly protein PilC
MPGSMLALLHASERARNMPWALEEMGDHLSRRAAHLWQRFTQVVSPLILLAVGASIAFIALAVFLPLITVLTELAK